MTKKDLSTIQKYALASANGKVATARAKAKEAEDEFRAVLDLITDELGIDKDDRKNWMLTPDHSSIEKIKGKDGEDEN